MLHSSFETTRSFLQEKWVTIDAKIVSITGPVARSRTGNSVPGLPHETAGILDSVYFTGVRGVFGIRHDAVLLPMYAKLPLNVLETSSSEGKNF